MKKIIISSLAGVTLMVWLTGCSFALGTGSTTKVVNATVGQQLIDLKKAKDIGALSDAEYDQEKAKILNSKQ
ncbi:MAG TPA: SHOCT domain-containing protein [Pseudomonadales bacterium]|nr:SHOCT domain-containing protein [Pseudomonadales bacterium]